MNKSETKYHNTSILMDEALVSLLGNKDYESITIKEICQKAGVNRSTFYHHYESMDGLLKECINYFREILSSYFNTERFLSQREYPERNLFSLEYFETYLTFVKEHKNIFLATLYHPYLFDAEEYFQFFYERLITPLLDEENVPLKERKYLLAYSIHGIIVVINIWFREDCRDSIESVAKLLTRYTIS
jgi:AcrR family transcriptional regulator